MQITSIEEAKEKQEVELEYKSYVNVCVCVRACVCSYNVCQNDILHMYVCVCVGVRACVCVQRVLLTSLCESFVILLVSPQRTTVFIAPGLQDAHSRSQVAQAQSSKSPLTMRCPGPNQVEEQP